MQKISFFKIILNKSKRPQVLCSRKLTEAHGVVGPLGDGEDVGGHLVPPLAPVHAHSPHRVDGEPLVRVDGDAEEPRVGLWDRR